MTTKPRDKASRSLIPSLREAASLINSGGDLGAVLRDLVLAACRHTDWTMGSIMGIDATHGHAFVIVRHDPTLLQRALPDRWELATSPSIVALQRNEPVFVRDAQSSEEFPGYRRDATERDYRSVLVMPMNCMDEQGRPMVLSVVSRSVRDVTPDELAFIGMIVHLGEIAVGKQLRLREETLAAQRLQNALQAHTSLLEQALADSSVPSLAAKVSALLPNPVVVIDFTGNGIVAGQSPIESRFGDAAWQAAAQGIFQLPLIRAARAAIEQPQSETHVVVLGSDDERIRLSFGIEPLTIDAETVGALMIFNTSLAFSRLDRLLLDSAKLALSVQMMRSVILFRFETRTLSDLFMELVERRWHDVDDVVQRAGRLGVKLAAPQAMALVGLPRRKTTGATHAIDPQHALMRLWQQNKTVASVVVVEDGLVCLFPSTEADDHERVNRILRQIVGDLDRSLQGSPIVVRCGLCTTLDDYPAAWERGGRLLRIARSFGRTGFIDDGEFGPLPVLVSAADAADVRAFVDRSIGSVADYDRAHGTPYLETLLAYLGEGCRGQACADAMGLHVTTLRYRLSRIEDLFGIVLDTPERRFALELAIRLRGLIDGAIADDPRR